MKKRLTSRNRQIDSVLALARVAEHRSFRAAAAELGVSVSAVSQSVRALETRAGVALLARTTRAVELTEVGQRFLDDAVPAAERLMQAFDAARAYGEQVTGLLRLNVPQAAGAAIIEPIIGQFCVEYPDVQVEIFVQDTIADIVSDGFDAGMRVGNLVDQDMVAVRVTQPYSYAVVGAPEYLRRFGRPENIEDLRYHRCIRVRLRPRDLPLRWSFIDRGQTRRIDVQGPLIVNDPRLNISAALRGLGLAYAPCSLVQAHVDASALELLLTRFCVHSEGIFLFYPGRKQVAPKLRAFIDFLRRRASAVSAPVDVPP